MTTEQENWSVLRTVFGEKENAASKNDAPTEPKEQPLPENTDAPIPTEIPNENSTEALPETPDADSEATEEMAEKNAFADENGIFLVPPDADSERADGYASASAPDDMLFLVPEDSPQDESSADSASEQPPEAPENVPAPSEGEKAEKSPETEEPPKKKTNILKELWDFFAPAIISCAILLFVSQFILMFATVPTGSMIPAIAEKSYIIGNRLAYGETRAVKRGDIVIFETDQSTSKLLVKRVVAVGGDHVELIGGSVFLNGELLKEPYVSDPTYAYNAGNVFDVPYGCVLVFGDNRLYSADARYWEKPYVPIDQIKAKVFFAVSLNRGNGYVRTYPNPFQP